MGTATSKQMVIELLTPRDESGHCFLDDLKNMGLSGIEYSSKEWKPLSKTDLGNIVNNEFSTFEMAKI